MRLPKGVRIPKLNNYIPTTKHGHVKSLMKNFETVKKFVDTSSIIGPPRSLFEQLYKSCAKLRDRLEGEVKSTGHGSQAFPKRSSRRDSYPNPKKTHTVIGQQPKRQNGSMVQQPGSAREGPRIRKVFSGLPHGTIVEVPPAKAKS